MRSFWLKTRMTVCQRANSGAVCQREVQPLLNGAMNCMCTCCLSSYWCACQVPYSVYLSSGADRSLRRCAPSSQAGEPKGAPAGSTESSGEDHVRTP